MTFSWDTAEEDPWEEPELEAPSPSRGRGWSLVGLALLLAGLGGFVIYREAATHIAETTGLIEEDVRSSYRLLQQAIVQDDAELFGALLSARDPHWVSTQQMLFAAGLVHDRAPLGLVLASGAPASSAPASSAPASDATAEPEIRLSPDLREATVFFTSTFVFQDTNGVMQTTHLRQTAVYRQGTQRWLLSPPPESDTDDQAVTERSLVTVTYATTDAVIAARLADDLQQLLATVCRQVTFCPRRFHLDIHFEATADALALLADQRNWLEPNSTIILPSPGLVGVPVDEAGYYALFRGYASHVVGVAVSQATGYICCERGLFYQALLDLHRYDLGISPNPLPAAAYRQVIRQELTFAQLYETLSRWWNRPTIIHDESPYPIQAALLLDFVRSQRADGPYASDLFRSVFLNRTLANMLRYDLPDFDPDGNNEVVEDAWLQYLLSHASLPQVEPPIPWPKQTLQLLCTPDMLPAAIPEINFPYALYRYDLIEQRMTPESSDVFTALQPLPDDSGVLLTRLGLDIHNRDELAALNPVQFPSRLLLWRQGEAQPLYNTPADAGNFLESIAPSSHYASLYNYYAGNGAPGNHFLLDLTDCDAQGCATLPLSGAPTWSPDGRRYLTFLPERGLYLGQPGQERLAPVSDEALPAANMAWLDNDTYAYVSRPDNTTNSEQIMLQSVPSGPTANVSQRELLQTADLLQFIGAHDYAFVQFYLLGASPANPDLLIVGFTPQPLVHFERHGYIVAVNRQSGELSLLLTLEHDLANTPTPFHFAPDGRWFSFITHSTDLLESEVVWYNLGTGRSQTFPISAWYADNSYDWSADGNWFVKANGRSLLLAAPAYEYEQVLMTGVSNCTRVAWINP